MAPAEPELTDTNESSLTTALVLSGGGTRGAFQAGALEVLKQSGYSFDVISGMSAGALNGVMCATGQFGVMLEAWNELTAGQVMSRNSLPGMALRYLLYQVGLADPPVSRFNNKPLQEMMERYLLGKEVKHPFHFGYVKLESGEYVRAGIPHEEGHTIGRDDLQELLASTAIPVIFNPVEIGGDTAVDGGLRNISPIREVLPYHPGRVILIPTEPVGQKPAHANVRDILDIAFRSIYIMLDEIFEEDIDRFLTVNRLVQQAAEAGCTLTRSDGTAYKYFEPLLIDPAKPLGDALDFDRQTLRERMEHGRQRAREVLGTGGMG